MREITYWQAINEAISEEMERDEKVFVIGEGVQQSPFMITYGLVDKFGPDRIMDAPLSETAIAGAAVGSAMAGYRPICDFNIIDFMYCAADEVLLKAAQQYFIHAGTVNAPVVFTGIAGAGSGAGPEHSHIPAALIMAHPGLKLALPSGPYDAKGLMKTAIRDNNPVVYMFHKRMMGMKEHVPEEEYLIPFGKADIKREGTDLTVLATSSMVHMALESAEKLQDKMSVEVIDPRTLEPFDLDTVLTSLEKTNRLLIVDEDTERCGVGAEIGMQVMEQAFDLLDAPVKRVCARNMPIAGAFMEKYCVPQPDEVHDAIASMMQE
jgi:pyruvate/2-oxoglutarate/acetoin dehydrogenase E1 component